MTIKLARITGFCMGVRRAISTALRVTNRRRGKTYTLGPLIHNPQVVELLKRRGIYPIDSPDEAKDGTIIIRAHGVPPELAQELRCKTLAVYDATCPRVSRVQHIVKAHAERGYTIIVLGDCGHAEVASLLAFAKGKGIVVQSAEEAQLLPPLGKVCVVAQTTQSAEEFEKAVAAIEARSKECKVFDTLCDSTRRRQEEVMKLARSCDAMVIVGGRHSANTRRLASLCEAAGTPTFLVETEEELEHGQLMQFKTVGVAGGTSTPHWMMKRVIHRLEQIQQEGRGRLWIRLAAIPRFVIYSQLQIAVGAYFITALCSLIQGIPLAASALLMASLYTFAMHTFNTLTDVAAPAIKEPQRARFYRRYKWALLAAATVCAVIAIERAWRLGPWTMGIVGVLSAAGIAYNLRIIPRAISGVLGYEKLRDIPGSRDIFTALAWAIVTVLIPSFAGGKPALGLASLPALGYAFTIILARSAALDLRDIEGDRMVGVETLPVLIGRRGTVALVLVLALAAASGLVAGALTGVATSASFLALPTLAYLLIFLATYEGCLSRDLAFDWLVDGNLFLAGICLLAYHLIF